MLKKILIVLQFTLFASQVFAASEAATALRSLVSYFRAMNGIVVSSSSGEVTTDLGENRKTAEGLTLSVVRNGEAIVHPVTGKVLGYKQADIGKITIKSVHPEYSTAKLLSGKLPQAKDKVLFSLPLNVRFVLNGLDKESEEDVEALIKGEQLFNVSSDNNSDYVIKIDKLSGITTCNVTQKDGKVIYSTSVSSEDGILLDSSWFINDTSLSLAGNYRALAVGRFVRGDSKLYVAVAQPKSVVILDLQSLKQVGELGGKFQQIVSLDALDMDGDGVDEIFISNIYRDSYSSSSVYQHDGQSYKLVQGDIDFLMRSYSVSGSKRRLLAQQLNNDGGYRGDIFDVAFKNGKYVLGGSVNFTTGKQLFGYLPVSDSLFINIAQSGRLSVASPKGAEYEAPGYYGDTSNMIRPNLPSVERNDALAVYGMTIYVRPHIEVLDTGTATKYYIIVRNEQRTKMFENTQMFSKSGFAVYSYNFSALEAISGVSGLPPIIMDICTYTDGTDTYLLVLNTKEGWLSSSSRLIRYKLNMPAHLKGKK
ncbi:hypothetical protein RsTz2092_12760 [Deferribacterales bacterium RsTz2092]